MSTYIIIMRLKCEVGEVLCREKSLSRTISRSVQPYILIIQKANEKYEYSIYFCTFNMNRTTNLVCRHRPKVVVAQKNNKTKGEKVGEIYVYICTCTYWM